MVNHGSLVAACRGRRGAPTAAVRILATLLLAGTMLALMAAPAWAHGRGSDASNFLSTITSTGGVDTLEWRIVNSDEYLQLTNNGDEPVMIPDYENLPYLRIEPDGVYRNRNSRATYVNEDRFGQTPIPTDIEIGAEPDWEKLDDSNSYAWHDHRIHWMAQAEPPGVATEPGSRQLVNRWQVPFVIDGNTRAVTGELEWVPGGSPWVWLLPALLVTALPVIYGLATSEPDIEAFEWRGLSAPAGMMLLVIAAGNLLHLWDDLFATPIPFSQSVVSAAQTAFFIAIAAFGAIKAIEGKEGAFTALGVASGATFIGQGLLYFGVLGASQTASLFPGWLTRLVVALSVAQVLPMAVAAVMGTRALLPEFDDSELREEAAGAGT
ncbi:hypothetical protein [Euzebya tangerina]|uniref:hypothetical protein n=1 Tax=Euzebya tangerina TaxID=591198 RepID=UPI0013C2BFEC|nr:hypothetical protein [Euzebya tangerina]